MAKPIPKAPVKAERFIYCGPSLPGGLLQRYTIYKGGLPVHLQTVIEKCPSVKSLFVPVAKLAAVNAAITSPGTLENLQYREITEFVRKGGLKNGV